MTIKEFVENLNGRFIGKEILPHERQWAKENNIVVVFAHLDDCIEFRGAIDDEVYINSDKKIDIGSEGIIPDWGDVIIPFREAEALAYFKRKDSKLFTVTYEQDVMYNNENYLWVFTTDLEHYTFSIHDDLDDVPYCVGIAFQIPPKDVETTQDSEYVKGYNAGYEAGYDKGYYQAQTLKRRGC